MESPNNLLLLLTISNIIIGLVILIIASFIVVNFFESQPDKKVKKVKKNIVETGSMAFFFIIFYLVIRSNIGSIENNNFLLRSPLIIFGLIIILIGLYFNVKGRIVLGKNWANQIIIYNNQTLATKSVYSIVRHPLYASIIWMFYGASIIYLNWLAFLLNTLFFIPFMYYRAKNEEKELEKEFKHYKSYKKEVEMFFPKIKWNK